MEAAPEADAMRLGWKRINALCSIPLAEYGSLSDRIAPRGLELQVGVHHHSAKLFQTGLRLPAQYPPSLGRVAGELIDLGRTNEARIRPHVVTPIEPDVPKRCLDKLL